MKKGSSILLLFYLLCAPFVFAANDVSFKKEEKFSSSLLQKDSALWIADLPAVTKEKISQHLWKPFYDVGRYEQASPAWKTCKYRAFNRNNNLSAYFTGQGLHLLPISIGEPSWHLAMTLSGYGYDGAMIAVQPVRSDAIKALGQRLEYRRGVITEWYVNDERGLEQGVTLNEPPAGKGSGPLVVEWNVSGSLVPRIEQKGVTIVFCKTGDAVLSFGGIKAWDATGRFLPAKLTVRGEGQKDSIPRIAFLVDDNEASYPVMIDPVFTQVKKLLASDGAEYDIFGISVSISGDTLVVGARDGDGSVADSGSAYIFDRNQGGTENWGQVQKIFANDGAADDQFGISASISGDTVVVGSRFDDDKPNSSGSAYIFDRNQDGADNWGQVQKVVAGDAAAFDNFGISVSIDEDTVVVGAFSDTHHSNPKAGSAYIFDRNYPTTNAWGQRKKIIASDYATNDQFGISVSISGDTVVVGAYGDDDKEANTGSVYIFDRNYPTTNAWGQRKKITASDGKTGGNFGISVLISGDTLVVGADFDKDNGSAYIFDRNQDGADNWGQVQKIVAGDAAAFDSFGRSVSISGDTVVVGAYGDDDKGDESGSAYVYKEYVSNYELKAMPWIQLLLLDD
jgi:hypothetical protein